MAVYACQDKFKKRGTPFYGRFREQMVVKTRQYETLILKNNITTARRLIIIQPSLNT